MGIKGAATGKSGGPAMSRVGALTQTQTLTPKRQPTPAVTAIANTPKEGWAARESDERNGLWPDRRDAEQNFSLAAF